MDDLQGRTLMRRCQFEHRLDGGRHRYYFMTTHEAYQARLGFMQAFGKAELSWDEILCGGYARWLRCKRTGEGCKAFGQSQLLWVELCLVCQVLTVGLKYWTMRLGSGMELCIHA